MAPVISLPVSGQGSNTGEPNMTDGEPLGSKIKSVNASCFCMSVNSVCTCIHLNGNFNKAKIKKVLTLIHKHPMCDSGPSTSTHGCVKRRKLLNSESSDEKVKISESKKVCKVTEMDSDDLDSDDLSADEANVS